MFKDINFKFAVISCLNEKGLYVDEPTQIKLALYGKRNFAQLDYDDIVPEIHDYYKQLPLAKSNLDLITEFNPSASNACYNLLVKEWSGEDNIFDIRSLDGIENLENLSVFNPLGLMEPNIDISALLKCKKLKTVYSDYLPDSHSAQATIEKLKMSGILVCNSQ
jgi:hypothetical protein